MTDVVSGRATEHVLADAVARLKQADFELSARHPSPFPLPVVGLDAVVAGTILALDRGDWWFPGLRERVGAVLRDTPLDRLVEGRAGARPYRVSPADTTPALRALVAVGAAAADRSRAAAVHLGIGSCSDGAFHEALNLAALLRPHVIFVVAALPLGEDAPLGPQLATTPAKLAEAFGIPSESVDGHDVSAVHATVRRAREAGGPRMVHANLFLPRET